MKATDIKEPGLYWWHPHDGQPPEPVAVRWSFEGDRLLVWFIGREDELSDRDDDEFVGPIGAPAAGQAAFGRPRPWRRGDGTVELLRQLIALLETGEVKLVRSRIDHEHMIVRTLGERPVAHSHYTVTTTRVPEEYLRHTYYIPGSAGSEPLGLEDPLEPS